MATYKNWYQSRQPNKKHFVIEDGWVIPKEFEHFAPPTEILDQMQREMGEARMYLSSGRCYNLTTHRLEDE